MESSQHSFTKSRIYQISVYKHLYHYLKFIDEFHHAIIQLTFVCLFVLGFNTIRC
jgi:hypothetical protein